MSDASTREEVERLTAKGIPKDLAVAIVLRQKGLISESEFTKALGYR